MTIRVLELGKFFVPTVAGSWLAEQGFQVTKWTYGRDPILAHWKGQELWDHYQKGKTLVEKEVSTEAVIDWICEDQDDIPIIIDNIRAQALEKWGVDPQRIAEEYNAVWVSERGELPGPSFDVLAQARALGDVSPYIPFYVADTSVGVIVAFKALAMLSQGRVGHYVVGHASAMAKLKEGELAVDREGFKEANATPWWQTEPDKHYGYNPETGVYEITYRDQHITEPPRDREWQLANLWHDGTGRLLI